MSHLKMRNPSKLVLRNLQLYASTITLALVQLFTTSWDNHPANSCTHAHHGAGNTPTGRVIMMFLETKDQSVKPSSKANLATTQSCSVQKATKCATIVMKTIQNTTVQSQLSLTA